MMCDGCRLIHWFSAVSMSPRWGFVFVGGVSPINILPLTGLKKDNGVFGGIHLFSPIRAECL